MLCFLQNLAIFKFGHEIVATRTPRESHQSRVFFGLLERLLDTDAERILTHALNFAPLANIDVDLVFNFCAELLVGDVIGISWIGIDGWLG